MVFAHVHDSRIAGNADFGPGWRLSLAEELLVDGDTATYVDESGAHHAATTLDFADVDGIRVAVLEDGGTVRTFEQADAAGARYVVGLVRTPARELVFDYDGGRLATVSHDGATLFEVERDRDGRIAALRDDHGRSVHYAYDADGRLETVRDLAGSDWHYLYRDDGLLGGAVDPEGRTYLAADHDAAGRVERAFADGRQHDYAYAPEGTTVAEATGEVHALTRNAAGVTTALSSTTGDSWSLALDAANRVSTLTLPERTIDYAYGGHGRVATMTVADSVSGTTRMRSYDYDAQARLISASGGGAVATVTYAAGLVRIDDGGKVFEYEVNDRGRVAWVRRGTDPEIRVERDQAGDVVEISQGYRSVRFGRDELGRIVDAVLADGGSARYFYDEFGNRSLSQHGDGRIVEYEHDAAGSLASIETTGRDGTVRFETVPPPAALVERIAVADAKTLEAGYARSDGSASSGIGDETFGVEGERRRFVAETPDVLPDEPLVRRDASAGPLSDRPFAVLVGGPRNLGQPDYGILGFGDDLGAADAGPTVLGVPDFGDAEVFLEAGRRLFDDASDGFETPSNAVFHAAETRIAERAFAAGSRTGSSEEESGGCPPPTVSVDSADVVGDRIVVTLQPPGVSGNLVVSLVGSPVHTVRTSTATGGTHTISFAIGSVPTRDYTGVRATWTVGTNTPSDTLAYGFSVLGNYRHSQYNTPSEASCTGAAQASYVTDNQCTFTATTLKSGFVSQVNVNGSGYSTNHGTVAPEDWCFENAAEIPDDAEERSFRSGHTVVGSCGAVGNATVAVLPTHEDLSCGDSVYIVGVGVKTVTDRCPVCTQDQLDNYTTDTACAGILDLGTYKTIKL